MKPQFYILICSNTSQKSYLDIKLFSVLSIIYKELGVNDAIQLKYFSDFNDFAIIIGDFHSHNSTLCLHIHLQKNKLKIIILKKYSFSTFCSIGQLTIDDRNTKSVNFNYCVSCCLLYKYMGERINRCLRINLYK